MRSYLNRPGCYRCRSVDAMSAQHGDSGFGDMTLSVHGGNDTAGPSIRTPITMANSYHLPPEPEKLDWSDPDHLIYTRNTGANQVALQRKLALMERGEDALALASDRKSVV